MRNDIKNYIELNIPELSGRLFPIFTTDISSLSVAYTFSDISRGHLNSSQLTLNVIGADYDECMSIHDKLSDLIAMKEDDKFLVFGHTKFRSELSPGGGALFNEEVQMWEISKYYIIDWRKCNGR